MKPDKIKVLYITGSGRSGSTLLERVLGELPPFVGVGELHPIASRTFPEGVICGCGRPFRECDFWRAVMQEAFGGFEQFPAKRADYLSRKLDRNRYIAKMLISNKKFTHGRLFKEYSEIILRLYKAIQKVSGRKIIIDSSKRVSTGFILKNINKIDLFILHLVRDSRGVAYSWLRKKRKPQVISKVELLPIFPPYKTAFDWISWNSTIELLNVTDVNYYKLIYEEFTGKPRVMLSEIIDFVNEKVEVTDFLDFQSFFYKETSHSVYGNPMRFNKGNCVIKTDLEWMKKMKPSAIKLVTAITLPLLYRYGYLTRKQYSKDAGPYK